MSLQDLAHATDATKQSISHHENARVAAKKEGTPAEVAQAFLDKLQAAFDAQSAEQIVDLFKPEDGLWRDMLIIDKGDFNTLRTKEISGHLKKFGIPKIKSLKVHKPLSAAKVDGAWTQAFIKFETDKIRGNGMVRLQEMTEGQGDWKAFTLFTALDEIKGHEELAGERRPLGAEHGVHEDIGKNWLDRRRETVEFRKEDPTVLIVGGGQNGLMLAARLTVLGIPNLIVDRAGRVGDAWRTRYHQLVLHDTIHADHMPYIPFPAHWPTFMPKDKIANWFEFYAEAMELNIWLKSSIAPNPTYDEKTKKWSVTVNRDGQGPREMKVGHLVLASGFSGEPRLPTFPQEEFSGYTCHSSQHKGGKQFAGKKAVVVGCCNSGHDIAADFAENGCETTIVQRSHTYVMSSKAGLDELLKGVYEEGGPPLDEADLALVSLPVDLLNTFHIEATKKIAEVDKDLLDGLKKAGFKFNPYPGGLFIKYFRDGGGYYIDVGASQLIIDGKIKVKQGQEITKLTKDGVLFADGEEIKADVVVFATGYTSQRETIRKVISEDVATRLGPCWGEDAQGEIPGVWRHSGVERFYLQAGNMFQARCYSKYLALLIQQQEVGLLEDPEFPHYKQILGGKF